MPTGNELESYAPVTFAPKDCVPIVFSVKRDNKGLGFHGENFSSATATNSQGKRLKTFCEKLLGDKS